MHVRNVFIKQARIHPHDMYCDQRRMSVRTYLTWHRDCVVWGETKRRPNVCWIIEITIIHGILMGLGWHECHQLIYFHLVIPTKRPTHPLPTAIRGVPPLKWRIVLNLSVNFLGHTPRALSIRWSVGDIRAMQWWPRSLFIAYDATINLHFPPLISLI